MSATRPSRHQEKGRRHLLDLDAPRQVVADPAAEERDLARVQRWVMSTLAVVTLMHMPAGLILAAMYLDDATLSSEIGLNVLAGLFGAFAVAGALAIHGRRVLSPWLLLGVVPTVVGLWLTLR